MSSRPTKSLTFADWNGNVYRIPRVVLRRFRVHGLVTEPPADRFGVAKPHSSPGAGRSKALRRWRRCGRA